MSFEMQQYEVIYDVVFSSTCPLIRFEENVFGFI